MKKNENLSENSSDVGDYGEQTRLKHLKHTKFLTQRIFPRISENMSYEIFKYVNSQDLLQIRASTLGGFQLVSNASLRSRINNYLQDKVISLTDLFANKKKINFLFEQKEESVLSFSLLRAEGAKKLAQNMNFIPNLQSLNLSIIFCGFIIIENNYIGQEGVFAILEILTKYDLQNLKLGTMIT